MADYRRKLALGAALAVVMLVSMGTSRCTTQPASLNCSATLQVGLSRGNCSRFTNPCVDQIFVTGDDFELDLPPGFTEQTFQQPEVTRTICAASNAPVATNQAVNYTYSRGGDWGQGTAYITNTAALLITATANPTHIDVPGQTSFLSATATGGTPPYVYAWTPDASLSPNGAVQNPTAAPDRTITYSLVVTDKAGNLGSASVTVSVRMQATATANPTTVAPGQPTQLTVQVFGGTPPYSISWSPYIGLDDPTSATPIATPFVTTNYQVTVTDATGARVSSNVTVNVIPYFTVTATATPATVTSRVQTVQLNAVVSNASNLSSPPYTYSWSPTPVLSPANIANPLTRVPATTVYSVVVTDSQGHSVTGFVTVTFVIG